MGMTLQAIEATINPDGSIQMERPFAVSEPTKVIVTVFCDDEQPNAETQRAMKECLSGLKDQPRFDTVETLMADLES
tara:strand:- start:2360 stop:2590 length:231 start_codon:yes stop_codon:yes gene_type:complete